MLQNESVALPFPPNFVFQDVDRQVLDREEIVAPTATQHDAWQAYLSKMLAPASVTPRAC
jgi:hypothetical protein